MARIYALDPATQALPAAAKEDLRADFPSKADIEAAGYLKDATAFAPALVNGNAPVRKGDLFVNVQDQGVLPGNTAAANQTALNALFSALAPNTVVYFPAGVYQHTNTTVTGKSRFAILGDGAELVAATRTERYLRFLDCADFAVRGITSRGATPELRQNPTRAFSLEGCSRFHLDANQAGPSEGVGIYVGDDGGAGPCVDGRVTNNFVTGTKADGIHVTGGSRGIVVAGNRVRDTGDDCIAVVSYLTDASGCENVAVTGNVVNRSKSRGLACVGGVGVTFVGNTVTDTRNSGIYVAVEQSYGIRPISDVTVEANTVRNANSYTPEGDTSAFINYAGIQVVGSDPANPVHSVVVTGNTVTGTRWHGMMFGSGGEGLYGLTVSNNIVRNAGAQAVLVQQATDVKVVGNDVLGAELDGISLVGTRGAVMVSENTVVDVNRNNTGTSRRGILVNSANITAGSVSNNVVRDPNAKNTANFDIASSANLSYSNNVPGNQGGNFATALPFVIPTTTLLCGAFPSSGTGGGVGVVGIRNAMTVPTANPSSGVVLYSEAGALKVRGANGVEDLGRILTSPNGTKYRLGVTDDGALTTTTL